MGRNLEPKCLQCCSTKLQGGIALPNITSYHQAALLEAIMQWWNEENSDSWGWEQEEVDVPIQEWVLCARDHLRLRSKNLIINTFN